MTELKIILDKKILDEDMKHFTAETPVAVLSETFFILPIQLTVNSKDVFGYHNVQTGEYHQEINLPVFSLILEWIKKLDLLPKEKKALFFLADAGQMIITYEGGLIKIRTNINEHEVEENYTEFYNAVKSTIKDLTADLKSEIPTVFQSREIKQELKL